MQEKEKEERLLKEFGNILRKQREQQNLYQSEVANMVGITQTYYSLIELGKRNIGLTLAIRLSQSLKLDISEIVEYLVENENSTPV